MHPAPRPAARRLLAGRYLASRASLLALPDGPVTGLDLSSGELVGLSFGPGMSDPAELASRIDTWNRLALPGCPAVRELRWHLGRPLLAFDLVVEASPACQLDPTLVRERCRVLGARLAEAGLGLAAGPADLALGPGGPSLRRPAIGPRDLERPLGSVLAELASGLLPRLPDASDDRANDRPAPRRLRLPRELPRSRKLRLMALASCAVAVALVASSLASSPHGGTVATAAPVAQAPLPLPVPLPAPEHPAGPSARVARPPARGGPARLLRVASRAPSAPAARARALRPREPRVREQPVARGWVEGLFVGS